MKYEQTCQFKVCIQLFLSIIANHLPFSLQVKDHLQTEEERESVQRMILIMNQDNISVSVHCIPL